MVVAGEVEVVAVAAVGGGRGGVGKWWWWVAGQAKGGWKGRQVVGEGRQREQK